MKIIRTSKNNVGDKRIVRKLLLMPVTIGNETRWLERATIRQVLVHRFDVTCGASWTEWVNEKFCPSI